jgi:hypothetical protein
MNRGTTTRARSGVLLATLALIVAACAAGVEATPSAPTPSPTATLAIRASNLRVGDGDDGRTVVMSVGSVVTLVLESTYWQVEVGSSPAVLALISGPSVSAGAMGTCVPGAGCGTATAAFRALAPGRATITASRATCGEALRCTGTDGTYKVTVVVGA